MPPGTPGNRARERTENSDLYLHATPYCPPNYLATARRLAVMRSAYLAAFLTTVLPHRPTTLRISPSDPRRQVRFPPRVTVHTTVEPGPMLRQAECELQEWLSTIPAQIIRKLKAWRCAPKAPAKRRLALPVYVFRKLRQSLKLLPRGSNPSKPSRLAPGDFESA